MSSGPSALARVLDSSASRQRFLGWQDLLESFRLLFADFSDDPATFFGKYGRTLEEVSMVLGDRWSRSHFDTRSERALCGASLVVLEGVLASRQYAETGRPPQVESDAFARQVNRVATDIMVVRFLLALYGVTRQERLRRHHDFSVWSEIDLHTLAFYRAGTTSMIFRAERRDGGERYAIKLVHFMFQRIGPIRSATQAYRASSESLRRNCPYLTKVFGSSSGWIVSEFIEGATLVEYLQGQDTVGQTIDERLVRFRRAYLGLLDAVVSLHQASDGSGHGDLSPSNILVQVGGQVPLEVAQQADAGNTLTIRLIDVGRNFLASSTIGAVTSPEGQFAAPEVLALPPSSTTVSASSDLYSLGLLLPICFRAGDPDDVRGGQLPSQLYRDDPELARVAADLADTRPEKRLALVGREMDTIPPTVEHLREYMTTLSSALVKSDDFTSVEKRRSIARDLLGLNPLGWLPLVSRAAGRLSDRDWPVAKEFRKFRRWASVALVSLVLCVVVSVFGFLMDYPAFGGTYFPGRETVLDWLITTVGYSTDRAVNWEPRIIGLTLAFAAYSYYMRGFGRLDLASLPPRALGVMGELAMRSVTFVALPFVVLGNLRYPRMWVWYSVMGMAVIGLNNTFVWLHERRILRRLTIQRRSSAGNSLETGYWTEYEPSEVVSYWAPSMYLYIVVVGVIAASLTWWGAQDWREYTIAFAAVNVVFFWWAQAVRQGPKLRAEVTRSAIIGERLTL